MRARPQAQNLDFVQDLLHQSWMELESSAPARLPYAHAHAMRALAELGWHTSQIADPAVAGFIAEALTNVGTVALRMGRPDVAMPYLCEAAWRAPDRAQSQRRYEEAAKAPLPRLDPGRYLIIKALGEGFFAEVHQLLAGLLLAQATNRVPVIDWRNGYTFHHRLSSASPAPAANAHHDDPYAIYHANESRDNARDNHTDAAFRALFEPISGAMSLETMVMELAREQASHHAPIPVWPPRWAGGTPLAAPRDESRIERDLAAERANGAPQAAPSHWIGSFVSRTERVVVLDVPISVAEALCWLPASHPLHGVNLWAAMLQLRRAFLVPRQELEREADRIIDQRLANDPFIAVHVRMGDMWRANPNLAAETARVPNAVATLRNRVRDRIGGISMPRVYLASDGHRAIELFEARYRTHLGYQDCARTRTTEGLHKAAWPDHSSLAREALLDVIVASRADAFVGMGCSHLSCAAAWWHEWQPGQMHLIGGNIQARRVPAWFAVPAAAPATPTHPTREHRAAARTSTRPSTPPSLSSALASMTSDAPPPATPPAATTPAAN